MCATSWINPIRKSVDDVFALHLMLAYAFSILARYRPAVWRELVEGSLDQYRGLISYYYSAFDHILPELALRAISRRGVYVTSPGSMLAHS
jgi:hypothetical protein